MLSRSSARIATVSVSQALSTVGNPAFGQAPQYIQQAPVQYDDDGKPIGPNPSASAFSNVLGADGGKVMTQSQLLKASRGITYDAPGTTHSTIAATAAATAAVLTASSVTSPPELSSPSQTLLSSTNGGVGGEEKSGSGPSESTSDSLWDILDGQCAEGEGDVAMGGDESAKMGILACADTSLPAPSSGRIVNSPLLPKIVGGRVVTNVDKHNDDADDLFASTPQPSAALASPLTSPSQQHSLSSLSSSSSPPTHFTSNSQFVQQLLQGFSKKDAAAKEDHARAKESWAREKRSIRRDISSGSVPLSEASRDWARHLARERFEEATRSKEGGERSEETLPSSSSSLSSLYGNSRGSVRKHYDPSVPHQIRSMLPDPNEVRQRGGGGGGGGMGGAYGGLASSLRQEMREAPTAKPRYSTMTAVLEEGDDDIVLDPVHDLQLMATQTTAEVSTGDSTATLPSSSSSSSQQQQSYSYVESADGKIKKMFRYSPHPHANHVTGDTFNPIRNSEMVQKSKISPDIIDLVTEEYAHMKQREIERRRKILYELTHPIPTDYTFAGKLVPPPPISFGKVTPEAVQLGEKMMTQQPYRLVREAKATDYFFEINELYMEIVMLGRANAGKSSLINGLLQQNVAKTSSLPNSTRGVNFYQSVTPEEIKKFVGRNPSKLVKLPAGGLQLTFVDLPGFGITGMSDKWRDNAIAATDSYLGVRRSVNTVFMCIDATKGLTHIDKRYLRWIENLHGTFYIVLTKCDAVSHHRLCEVMREIYQLITDKTRDTKNKKLHSGAFNKVFPFIIPVSAKTGHNMDLLRGLIVETSGMISGGKLREMLKRKMEERNMLAERDELKRIAEARAIEKEIVAEERRLQQAEERKLLGIGGDEKDGRTLASAEEAFGDENEAPHSSSPSSSSSPAPATTSIPLNAALMNKLLANHSAKGSIASLSKGGGGGVEGADSSNTSSSSSLKNANYNLGVSPIPMMLQYNSVTGEIEEKPMNEHAIRAAAMAATASAGGGATTTASSPTASLPLANPIPSPTASVFANHLKSEDLDALAAAADIDKTPGRVVARRGGKGGEEGTHSAEEEEGAAFVPPSPPPNSSAVIGLGTDAELISAQFQSGRTPTASEPKTAKGLTIHSHQGTVSRYLDKFEAFEAQCANEEALAIGIRKGGAHGIDGDSDEAAPAWLQRLQNQRKLDLSKAKVFIEEPTTNAGGEKAKSSANINNSKLTQWVERAPLSSTRKQSQTVLIAGKEDADYVAKKGDVGTSSRNARFRKMEKFLSLSKKKNRHGGGGGGISANHGGSSGGGITKTALDRSVLRPYSGLKALNEAAVVVEKKGTAAVSSLSAASSSSSSVKGLPSSLALGGGGGGGGVSTIVSTSPAETKRVMLAKEALRNAPNAPWRGLARAAGSGVLGMDGEGSAASPELSVSGLFKNGSAAATNNQPPSAGSEQRKRSLLELSDATKSLWATDESSAELARLHLEEERREEAAWRRERGEGGFGAGASSSALGGHSFSSSSTATRKAPRSDLGTNPQHKRSFINDNARNQKEIEDMIAMRGPMKEDLSSMQKRLEREHDIKMSKKELNWYSKTAGKTVRDFDTFHGETKIKMHMNAPFMTPSLYTASKIEMGRESRISASAQTVGLSRKYGRSKSYWTTSNVSGVDRDR